MCTAITYKTNDFYFGRTLDYEHSFGEEVVVTPRNFKFEFNYLDEIKSHYAIIGMARVENDFPLYFDAVNEKGLCMAGLNFVGNAIYFDEFKGKTNLAQFEFIPFILGICSSVKEAKEHLENINLTNTPFSDQLPVSQLHFIIADSKEAITIESVKEGLKVYENTVGVLTNNPTFPEQIFNLNNYINLSAKEPHNRFSDKINLVSYSRGMGAIGLPGDLSAQSRFVRATFTKFNSVCGGEETESVGQFFHILGTVSQTNGVCDLGDGKYEKTVYTSCMNTHKGIYYYTTYNNRQITAVDMRKCDLNSKKLFQFELIKKEQINAVN